MYWLGCAARGRSTDEQVSLISDEQGLLVTANEGRLLC